MAHETVPADIAAAMDEFEGLVRSEGHEFSQTREADIEAARSSLNAAIIRHLQAYDEMKAALGRIEQGV